MGDAGSGMFRWTEETGLQLLSWGGSARATSADGSVIVGNGLVSEGLGAIRWIAETGAHLIAPSRLRVGEPRFPRMDGSWWARC